MTTIKSTYSLDGEAVRALEDPAGRRGVSRSGSLHLCFSTSKSLVRFFSTA